MRLLTFVCFFNFSGVHNGYTMARELSAVNFQESVGLAGQSVRTLVRILVPAKGLLPLAAGRDMAFRFMAWAPRVAENALTNLKPTPLTGVRAQRSHPDAMNGLENRTQRLQKLQYLKELREVWNKETRRIGFEQDRSQPAILAKIFPAERLFYQREVPFYLLLPLLFMAGFFMKRFLGGGASDDFPALSPAPALVHA